MELNAFDHIQDEKGFIYGVRSVKDSQHPRTPLLYVPSQTPTTFSLDGTYYTKLADETGFVFLAGNFPDLVFKNPITEEEYVSVNPNNVQRVFNPKLRLEQLAFEDNNVADFIALLESQEVRANDVGVIGSNLIGFETETFHDYDIVIYGKENAARCRALQDHNQLSPLTNEEIIRIALTVGLKNNPIGHERILKVTRRRQRCALVYNGNEFSLKFSFNHGEHPSHEFDDYSPDGELQTTGVVVDDQNSTFAPYTYKIREGSGRELQVSSYSFAFVGSSEKDDIVEVFGTKRKGVDLVTLDKPHHYIVSE